MPVAPDISWRSFLKGKWLLWDTCAVIRLIDYKAENIFIELNSLDVKSVYIHPVQLELLATADQKQAIKRAVLMTQELTLIPFTIKDLNMAKNIQTAIGSTSPPSAVDLYVGATLANNNPDKMCLITQNVKDFPSPYFNQECHITLSDVRGACSLTILTFDKTSL
jgi:predicted nucleic acid-binding protein